MSTKKKSLKKIPPHTSETETDPVSETSPEDGNRSSFRNVLFSSS
jgi:hypothetical protein